MPIKQPSDHAVRAAAIDPARSFLIQAPAGSGKTELLTDRILALLATVNRPEEIVAITFTRKAASEMHARVLAKLRAGQAPQPEEPYKLRGWQLAQDVLRRDRELGWNLLDYPARLSIRTIDSFCTWLVRAMPWLSSLGGLPAVTDNAREHYEAAAQATLAMADDHASVAGLIAHLDVDLRAAQSLLADMLASRDQWLPLLGQGADVDALLDNLDSAIAADLASLARAMPAGWAQALAPSASTAANVLAAGNDTLGLEALQHWDGTPFGDEVSSLPQWQALANLLLTAKGGLRRRVTIKEGFEAKAAYKDDFLRWLNAASESEAWVSMLAGIRLAPREGYTGDQQAVLRLLIEVLWLAAAQLNVRFTEAAEVDFAEISQRALQALGQADEPTDLLLALDTVIQHILVDEFQDTSQSQIDLLERLTSGWQAGDGRTLFLVGDPMQSIYRFRKADVGCFLKVKEQGLGGIALTALALTDNFRSQAHLVEWVNSTCGPVFPKKNHSGLGAITYTPSVPFKEGVQGISAEFHPVWLRKGGADDADDDPVAAAESVAIQLAKEALLQHPDSEHPVAILVRARTHLDGIVHRLAQQNIPCRAVELVSLQSRQAVIDLAQLARALSHAGDRLAWLSVLRSPLCGLTLDSLHALFGADLTATVPALLSAWLARDAAGQPGIDDMEARRLRHAAAVLLDAGNASGTIPFAAWLEACWQRLGGADIYCSASDRTDAERLLRLIEELAPYGGLNPVDLESRLAKLYAAPSGSGRAVEVMTIHKSKGLEFDTVILAGLHKRPRGDTPPLMRFEQGGGQLLLGPIKHKASEDHDPVSVYLAEREKKRAAYETDRLLYVALTRAKQQLHLIGVVGVDDMMSVKRPAGASLLGRLWEHMKTPDAPEASDLSGDADLAASTPGGRLLVRMAHDSLPRAQSASPAAGQGTPWQWRPEAGDESVIGTVAHAWLERLGKEGIDAWPARRLEACLPVFRKQLARAGLAAPALDAAAQVLRDALVATVESEKGAWLLRVARAHREWSLLDISGRVSIIDLAISQEHDWLVVDYKTGVPQDGETRDRFAARMRERYREQIERYCAHVSALDGRPARGALYFPRADVWVDYAQTVAA
ncbi:UvrD-helicase domain-containing protein [Pusillimonas sp. SM2304]|uniref:UvrD-helicase domain-containing protein n=1 Tax=Pusillimonas sp. SM2304 TaxID=3073241 RepID=UPI002874DC67|nr:UvrD-helicase domain-containing protein [Pusillimonas sp. SM2304]MDS1142513.1 UvrD-helicase domain-containing protein [Pusillimonas sp. SM2304]